MVSAERPNRVMRMVHRPTQAADLDEALALLPPQVSTDPAERTAIARLWPALLTQQPTVQTAVMEDLSLPPGQRILGWGASVLLSPQQAQGLGLPDQARAYLARRVYADLLAGRLRLMDDRELGRCNAAGEVVGLVLHFTQPPIDLADPQLPKILTSAQESFRLHHTGFHWQAIYVENSVAMLPIHREMGFEPCPLVDEDRLADCPEHERPVLLGLDREQARLRLPGTTLRNCFECEPPRFRFSAQQRKLLWLALFDDADAALGPELGVSVHGLKKLWRGIYDRVNDVEPAFFGDDAGDDEGKRGPEKRRQVLAYVRQRLEELRPWSAGSP